MTEPADMILFAASALWIVAIIAYAALKALWSVYWVPRNPVEPIHITTEGQVIQSPLKSISDYDPLAPSYRDLPGDENE